MSTSLGTAFIFESLQDGSESKRTASIRLCRPFLDIGLWLLTKGFSAKEQPFVV